MHARGAFQALVEKVVGGGQGVYMQAADGTVLATANANRAVHPASVTKIATTLALLAELGPAYRFKTTFSAGGPLRADGTLDGDLIVDASGDPFLISESALLIMAELHRFGVKRVRGRVRVNGRLLYNWREDDGARLARGFAGYGSGAAWAAVQGWRMELAGTPVARHAVRFENQAVLMLEDGLGASTRASAGATVTALVSYESPPLSVMLKSLNSYSNNVLQELSFAIGGPEAVERIARERVPEAMRAEITITDASGLGTTNRMSPRAAVAILHALHEEAGRHRLQLHDLLPVTAKDVGTLRGRLREKSGRGVVVGKTGTYPSLGISAIAGVIRTEQMGDVYFAVHNTGIAVGEARRRQDALLRAVIREAGSIPFPYEAPMDTPVRMARVRRVHAPLSVD